MTPYDDKIDRVFLIGPMGAGKTTIGKILAKNFKMDFIDSDAEIERRTGASVSWVFDVEGENGFRDREEHLLQEVTKIEAIILATGGGAVLRQKNRQVLSHRGLVVYLRANVEDLLERMRGDEKRPLLQVDDPKRKIRELVEEREPLYLETADLVIETHRLSFKLVAERLTSQLSERLLAQK